MEKELRAADTAADTGNSPATATAIAGWRRLLDDVAGVLASAEEAGGPDEPVRLRRKLKEILADSSAAFSACAAFSAVHMLHWGTYERGSAGPFAGPADIDFAAAIARFRADRYRQAELAGEDSCFLSEAEFAGWLAASGILAPLEVRNLYVDIDADPPYEPRHWPECPSCGEGRGEDRMGQVDHRRNAATWFRSCIRCGHRWDVREEAYRASAPMIPADGRDIPGSCVPYAIAQACGLPIELVIDECRRHGWRQARGIDAAAGITAALALGAEVTHGVLEELDLAGRRSVSLGAFLTAARPDRRYIVKVKGHWLAVVCGENRDAGGTRRSTPVLDAWEIRPAADACSRAAAQGVRASR